MNRSYYLIIFILSLTFYCEGQTTRSLLIEGDKHYEENDYGAAEEQYRKASIKERSHAANFNLGNSVYQQERYEEAVDQYEDAVNQAKTPEQRSRAMYNLGNTYFQMQDLENAIKQYKEAIKQDPENKEARYNLGISKVILQQQKKEEQEQQDSDQENSEDQNKEDEEQEQENKEQKDSESNDQKEQEEQKEQQEQQSEESDSTENKPPPVANFDSTRLEKQTLDSLDALKLLQILEGEEQKIQEKIRKFDSKKKKPEKDW